MADRALHFKKAELLTQFARTVSLLITLAAVGLPSLAAAADSKETAYVYGSDRNGVTRQLAADRTPALYTADFGDCLGGDSLFNITRFDTAYYADNMTVVFHLEGTSSIRNESTMMVITMEAYGETRYTQAFDPCLINMWDLCPLNSSIPITVYGAFALDPIQTASIPDIALQIPDFDGFVSLAIFANSTQGEIGCFQAAMTNGNSLGIPDIVAPTVAFFVAISVVSSFLTASYGVSAPLMRAHYAHSLSVALVFETLQTIFFTGALSLHWPSVLEAWWSNFAWAAGLISVPSLVTHLGSFSGVAGNASQVGNASPMLLGNGAGQMSGRIYGSSAFGNGAPSSVFKRKAYNSSNPFDYTWGGDPISPGVPLPGTWQSFSGTLGGLGIPSASAFTLCVFWMAAAVVAFPAILLAIKWLLELLSSFRCVRQDCMAYYRTHHWNYALHGASRVVVLGFPSLTTLAIFQFTLHSSPGSTALAAIVLGALLLGLGYACTRAIRTAKQFSQRRSEPESQNHSPPSGISTTTKGPSPRTNSALLPHEEHENPRHPAIYQDEAYIKRFGWLSARYRDGCWWFFAAHLLTQFVRACILGGGADNESEIDTSGGNTYRSGPPTAQVVIYLLFEVVAFAACVYWRPFESRRNMALGVWALGAGRVLGAALCVGLLPQIGLGRIGATVIGFVIIVVQVLMLAVMVVLIIMSAVSTWLSLTRNQDEFHSEMFFSLRKQYLETLLASATGAPPPPSRRQRKNQAKASKQAEREAERVSALLLPPKPSFNVLGVWREPKIEDVHFDESDGEATAAGRDACNNNNPRRDADAGPGESSGSSGSSGSGGQSGNSSTNGDGIEGGPFQGSRGGTPSPPTAFIVDADHGNDDGNDKDTLGDLGDLSAQSTKRRRANSGSSGNIASLVGSQVYDPARVIARLNRSRTNSAASLQSVSSAPGSLRRVSEMSARSGLVSPHIGVLSGRRSASPFGGRASSPFDGTLSGVPGTSLLESPLRSSSVPLVPRPDLSETSGRTTPNTAGPGPRRMTPTRETLQRYSSERQQLRSQRANRVPT